MGSKTVARMRRLRGFASGVIEPSVGPAAISLETTVRCNLTCPMCPRTDGGYPQEDMAEALLYRVLDELASMGGDYVYLYGLGEPFMDKRLFDVLRHCRQLGLGTIVSTNGTFLNAENRRALLRSPCDHLIVSVDGHSAETYGRYRPGGEFSAVTAGLRALAQEKVNAKAKMALTVQMIRLRHNVHEQEDFVRDWQGQGGVDLVRLKEEELGFESLGLKPNLVEGQSSPCHILWRGPLIVRYTGDVFACHPMANGGERIGNLDSSSLAELWASPRLRELRALHVDGQSVKNASCKNCPVAKPKRAFALGAMAVPGIAAQRLIPIAEQLSVRRILPFLERSD